MPKHNFHFLEFKETKKLFKIFNDNFIEARFVGGCVRDAFLGLESDDFDIAVNKNIFELMDILKKSEIKCIPTGLKYGSITAILNGIKFEITQLRKDINCLGRECDTERVSEFEIDAKRRDFTINSIYVSENGEIFDYFDGISDLKNHRVIFIGDPESRIKEDYLRILRYYRFAAKLSDFSDTYSDVIKKLSKNLNKVSIERIQKELLLILNLPYNLKIFNFICKNNVFENLNLENYTRFLDIYSSTSFELKAYILFGYDVLIHKFKLPKTFKKLIKFFKIFEQEKLIYCAYKMGKEFAKSIMTIKDINYNIKENFPQDVSYPQFPVSYHDLPLNTLFANRKLKACEKWWTYNNFTPSKEDCLNFIDINSKF